MPSPESTESELIPEDFPPDAQVPALALMLMQRSANENIQIYRSLYEAVQHDLDEAVAELRAVRARITELCRYSWTPSTHAIMAALYDEEYPHVPGP